MNGQGNQQGFNNAGIPQKQQAQRPRFNFKSKDVKKEITPDFMAAQLASFGNSSKLKTLPAQNSAQQQNTAQPQFVQQPMGMYQMPAQNFQQPYNQGFRQPMMGFNQGFGNQTRPGIQNISQQPRQNMPMQGFGPPSNMQFSGSNSTNQAMFNQFSGQPMPGNTFQTMPQQGFPTVASPGPMMSPSLSNTPSPRSSTPSTPYQTTPQPQGFPTARSFNPTNFSNPSIHSSTSNSSQPFSGFQPTSQQSSQANSKNSNDMFAIFNSTSQPVKSAEGDPFSNLRGPPQGSDKKRNDSMPDSSGFDAFSSFSKPSAPSNATDLFGSKPFAPSPKAPVIPAPATANKTAASQDFGFAFTDNFSPATPAKPVASTTRQPPPVDMFAPSKPQQVDMFAPSKPQQVDMFGQSPFDDTASQSKPPAAPNPETDLFAVTKSTPSPQPNLFASQPQQVDFFGPSSATTPLSKPPSISPNTSNTIKESAPVTISPSSGLDKYSVFSEMEPSLEVNNDFGAVFDSKPEKPAETPSFSTYSSAKEFSANQNLFGDSFEPFTKPAPDFAAFDAFSDSPSVPKKDTNVGGFDPFGAEPFQPVETKPADEAFNSAESSANSTVRTRPSSKTPRTMIVLPPPSKPTKSTKTAPSLPSRPSASSKPAVSPFDPFGTTDTAQATQSLDFDPFSVEADGALPSKLATKSGGPPPKPPPSYNTSSKGPEHLLPALERKGAAPPAPPRPATKRPAPPPPSRTGKSSFYASSPATSVPSLLDMSLDSDTTTSSLPASKPTTQPLLILPSSDPRKPGGPPGRPPPPKELDNDKFDAFSTVTDPSAGATATSIFAGMPPPLPPRPGAGHALYHYILKTGPHAVALFDFEAENGDELDFKVGDVIKLEADISADWYEGSLGTKIGIFPKNIVDVKRGLTPGTTASAPAAAPPVTAPTTDVLDAWGDAGDPSPPSPPTPEPEEDPILTATATSSVFDTALTHSVFDSSVLDTGTRSPTAQTCVALYDFEGEQGDELSFREGDVITVMGDTAGDWIEGKVGSKTGIFPTSFVSFADQSEIPPRPTSEELKAANISISSSDPDDIIDHDKKELGVYSDFAPEAGDEIALREGDMVRVLSVVDADWLRGRHDGAEGIFPASFVPAVPDSWNIPNDTEYTSSVGDFTSGMTTSESSDDTSDVTSVISDTRSVISDNPEPLGKVEVVADFEPENDFELGLKKGDVVNVTAKLDQIWLEGDLNGNSGIFPVNFVRWLEGEGAVSEPAFAANPLMSEDIPKVLNREETLTALPVDPDLTPRAGPAVSRQDTLRHIDPDVTPCKPGNSSMLSPSFSMSNPFSGPTEDTTTKPNYDVLADIQMDEAAATSAFGTPSTSLFSEPPEYGDAGSTLEKKEETEEENQLLSPDNPFVKSPFEEFTTTSPFSPESDGPFGKASDANDPFGKSDDAVDPFSKSNEANDPFSKSNEANDPFGQSNPFTGLPKSPVATPAVLYEMRALFDFEPDNQDELGFREKDIIQVIEFVNEEWLKGTCKGKEGLFPAAFAERIG